MKNLITLQRTLSLLLAGIMLFFTACAAHRPVLAPNDHYQTVGEEQAEQDIAECQAFAEERASSSGGKHVAGSTAMGAGVGAATGAVGGAVSGSPGKGAAVGAAIGATWGLLRGLFSASKPSRAYRHYVNQCLEERGYEPTKWE